MASVTFEKFSGINNVLPSHRLAPDALARASNVDIGMAGELSRRAGCTLVDEACHKNLWQADGFILATVDGGDLVAIQPNGTRTVVCEALGPDRVWYCDLPDGRTAFSNGLICGIASASGSTGWGVTVPETAASVDVVAAPAGEGLDAGDWRYLLTHTRIADGREGHPIFVNTPITIQKGSGLVFMGLPELDGHRVNIYLSHGGSDAYLAGSTDTGIFSFTGINADLVQPCRTESLYNPPAGTVMAMWRGRVLLAVGPVLYASLPGAWEHFDPARDFKTFTDTITLIQPVDDGVYIGTTSGLSFMQGTDFDKLVYQQVASGPVVLGSGVSMSGELIQLGQGVGQGSSMICICGGVLVAGFNSGNVVRLTEGRYRVPSAITQVSATFRMVDGIPQYIAVPQ